MPNAYTGTEMSSEHVCSLMRRINALEAQGTIAGLVFDRKWTVSGLFGLCVYGSEVYCVEVATDKVRVYDLNGNPVRQWGTSGYGAGQFVTPDSIHVYLDEVYVSDVANNMVHVFDLDGNFQRAFGSSEWPSAADNPTSVFCYQGEVFVANNNNTSPKIHVFSTDGTYLRRWGTKGSGDGELNLPRSVFVYNSEVYVAEDQNERIQVFDLDGNYIRKWGSGGGGDGQFNRPYGVHVSVNRVFVVERSGARIQVFDTNGTFLEKFGSSGTGDGEFAFPASSWLYGGELYVEDTSNQRVQVLTYSTGTTQTPFYSYTTTAKTSLGTPDSGVSVPNLNALNANDADIVPDHIVDMRTAIEALAPFYTNPATGNAYNWTSGSADNLYYVAMGDRTNYGATGGAKYDWTRTISQMEGDYCYDIDIGEVDACLAKLEAS